VTQHKVSVVLDAVQTQPHQLVQAEDGTVYVVFQDGQQAQALIDNSALVQTTAALATATPPAKSTAAAKAAITAASAPSPQVIDLTSQPETKIINLSMNRASNGNQQQPAASVVAKDSRAGDIVRQAAQESAHREAAAKRPAPVATQGATSAGEPLAKVAKHQSSVEIVSVPQDMNGPIESRRTYQPPTDDEEKVLTSITNELFESMTGFKGLVVLSLAERLARTYSYTYLMTGDKMGPLQEKIRLFLIRIRLGVRYPALADMFGMEVASAMRFCQEISELFHYGLQQKKVSSLATSLRSSGKSEVAEQECSGKAVIEIQTEIPIDPAERFHFYSPKNKMHTVKFLVAIGPDGSIVFVSNAYRGNTTDDTLVQDCGVQTFVTRNLPDAKALPYIKTAVKTMKRFEILHFVPSDFLPEMDGILPVVAHLAKYFPAQIFAALHPNRK